MTFCTGGLSVEKARECIPQIRSLATEYGRDPSNLEFSVLLMGGNPPSTDLVRDYADAGVSRLVIAAAASAAGDGVRAVREVAPVLASAARL